MSRRSLCLLIAFLMAVAGLGMLQAFLTPAAVTATEFTMPVSLASTPVTITFWHPHFGARGTVMQQFIDEFNATHAPSVTVVGVFAGGYNDIHTQVISGLQSSGPLPNAVVAYPNAFADFARYGGVRFLDDYFDDPTIGVTDTADFYPGIVDYYRLGEYGNQLAGLQHGRSIEIMYYNADLLTGAGVTVPTTWDDFEGACISVTSANVTGTITSIDASRFATWLWSRGGRLLSADLNRARFDEAPGIQSLLLFQNLIEDGYARLPYEPYEDLGTFGAGKVAFTFGSSSAIPYYASTMENGAQQAWGVTHVPTDGAAPVVDSYGAGVGVLHESEASDRAAWLFIKWLSERDQTARWAALSGYFPVRSSAESHPSMTQKLAADPYYAQAFALQPLGRSEPGIRGYEDIRAILNHAMNDTLAAGAEVTATLQAAADAADAILAESGPDAATIPPTGGTLTYTNTEGLEATVDFPAGAVVTTETVAYVPLNDLPTNGLAFALVPNLTLTRPVTLTLRYRDEDIVGMDEEALRLYNYDWSTNAWVEAQPCGGYVREPENNVLKAAVCHFSDYALDDWKMRVYLPLVLRE